MARPNSAFALAALLLLLASPALAARSLKQVGGYGNVGAYGSTRESIINSGYAGTSSVGAIDSSDSTSGSQAAAYARGAAQATGLTALGLSIAEETGGGSGANAAADLIRRQAGYQGNSIAGDIFSGDSRGASPAEDAIRRTMADNALIQSRINARTARAGSANPWNI